MALQDEGKVRMIGVSNTYKVAVLEALGSVRKVQVVQNRWYERNGWDRDVTRYCKANGVMYQYVTISILPMPMPPSSLYACGNAHAPSGLANTSGIAVLCRSFWTLTGSPSLLGDQSIAWLAQKHNCTQQQVVFKIAQMGGVVPLAGSKNEERMRDGVEAEKIDLSHAESQRVLSRVQELLFGYET